VSRGFRPVLPVAALVVAVFTGVLWAQGQGLLDTEPPTLTVRAPPSPATDPWVLDVRVHDAAPGVGELTVSLDGTPESLPRTGGSWRLPLTHLEPGLHEVVVVARDASWSRNGVVERLVVEVPAPEPETRPAAAPTAVP
jgi:hypothetical protein